MVLPLSKFNTHDTCDCGNYSVAMDTQPKPQYFNVSEGHLLLDPFIKLPIDPRFRVLWQYNVLMTGEPMTCFNYCLATVDEMKGNTLGYA